MKSIGSRKVFLTGSSKTITRAVYEKEDGTFWVTWGKQKIEVRQVYNDKNATAGWRTVEAY